MKEKENKLETYLSYVVVSLSLIIGSFGCFWLYVRNYLKADDVVRTRIESLLDDMSVLPDKRTMYMFIMSSIGMLLLWVVGFIMYKIIFKIAKVTVTDVELLIAIGTAYTLSFLIGCFMVGKIELVFVVILTNLIEMCAVYIGLFDKIRKKVNLCVFVRSILLVLNVVIAVVSK